MRSLPALLFTLGCDGAEVGTTQPPPQAHSPAVPAAISPPTAAPIGPTGLGRAPSREEIAAWDLDVGPSWQGLPAGKGTIADGERLYTARCAACHGPDAHGGQGFLGPDLVATEPLKGFESDWRLPKAIGNWWPHASTLFDYIRRSMPQTAPGSLTVDETYALTAFLLFRNQAIGADVVLDENTIKAVQMPTQVRFVPDDRDATTTFR